MAKCRSKRARPRCGESLAHRRHPGEKREPQKIEVISAPDHFSHSALKQLRTCPLQYRLQRIDGASPSHRSPSLVLGGVYHEVLANALRFVEKDTDLPAEALRLWFDDFWAEALESHGPPIRWTDRLTPQNQRDLGRAMVATWHDQGLPIFTQAEKILAVEEPFRVELVHSDGRVLRTPLAGIIDAVVLRADGTVVVVDHKTAKQAYSATYVDLNLQATAYTYAARKAGHRDCTFEFHTMLKRKKPELAVVPAPRGRDSFDRLFWVARQAEKLVEGGTFLPAAPTWFCDSCECSHACVTAHRPVIVPIREAPAIAS